jgi:transcriptional regulator with XRE-family HTH domain
VTKVSDLHRKWSEDPAYKAAYEALANEYANARKLIQARARAGLSQTEVAKRMKTSQSYVARLETGKFHPTMAALARYAEAVDAVLHFELVPRGQATPKPFLRISTSKTHKKLSKVNPATGRSIKRNPKSRSAPGTRRRA